MKDLAAATSSFREISDALIADVRCLTADTALLSKQGNK
jgi:hypothetical protein